MTTCRRVILLAISTTWGLAAPRAWAAFTDAGSAAASYASDSLAAPTYAATSGGACTLLFDDRIVVTWSPSPSTWADGYEIARATASNGPYVVVGTVSGRDTTTFDDGPLPFSTTYHYVIRATRNTWRSTASPSTSRTTRNTACL